jgi:hypothetical protein
MVFGSNILCLLLVLLSCHAQEYANYARNAGVRKKNNRGTLVASVVTALFTGVTVNWLTGRKLKKKYDKEKKDLLQVEC